MAAWFKNAISGLDFLRHRKSAYQQTFTSIPGQQVLMDLAQFCRANQSCFDADPRIHAVAEGRREVWLRIINHLHLTTPQLFALYTGHEFNPTPQETSEHE